MYVIIDGLMNIYSANPVNKFLMILAIWLVWPGSMFLVGWIGESRLTPIWKHQSKAFLPGDLTFGVIVIAFIGLYAKIVPRTGTTILSNAINTGWIWSLAFAISLAICFALRDSEKNTYEVRALHSPTKILHDIMGYTFIPLVLLSLLAITAKVILRYYQIAQKNLPMAADKNLEVLLQLCWPYFAVMVLAIAVYIGCLIYDKLHPATSMDVFLRHPTDWKPLWRQ